LPPPSAYVAGVAIVLDSIPRRSFNPTLKFGIPLTNVFIYIAPFTLDLNTVPSALIITFTLSTTSKNTSFTLYVNPCLRHGTELVNCLAVSIARRCSSIAAFFLFSSITALFFCCVMQNFNVSAAVTCGYPSSHTSSKSSYKSTKFPRIAFSSHAPKYCAHKRITARKNVKHNISFADVAVAVAVADVPVDDVDDVDASARLPRSRVATTYTSLDLANMYVVPPILRIGASIAAYLSSRIFSDVVCPFVYVLFAVVDDDDDDALDPPRTLWRRISDANAAVDRGSSGFLYARESRTSPRRFMMKSASSA
jgi:hypothetical protein